MNSDAPFAEEFQDMVYETILPNIRKYGSYQVENQLSLAMEKLAIKEKSEEELQERLEHAKREAEEYKQYALTLKDLAISDQKRPLNDVIYISTSKAYAGHNRYKVGGVEGMEKLKPRFSGYNGRSSVDDEWYYSDIFKVANFRAAEKRIEDVLGRFRERKNKEIYVLHYSDLRRYVEWICEHYEDEIEEFNKELDVLISNLNKHKLRPVIPPPYQGTSATITRIVDGVPSSITIESTIEEQFKHKIKVYLNTLEPTTKEVKRTELFEQVPFNFNRIDGWRWLKEVISKFKPELNLKYR
jgi:SOS response regulatory protein OraA/RecX